jgi:hypothetical protein
MADQFATCTLAPGTEPDITQSDPVTREYTFSCVLRGTVGVLGDCLTPNTTTTAATSGLSATRDKGDDFSAWPISTDFQDFLNDTTENPNYENSIVRGPPYSLPIPSGLPGYFWDFGTNDENGDPVVGATNRNRISQLAVNGGHRTVKMLKTAADDPTQYSGFEIWAGDRNAASTIYSSFWARLRFQYSANFPLGDDADLTASVGGVFLFSANDLLSGPTREWDVTIATGTTTNPSSVLTISHKSTPNTAPTLFEVPLGDIADLVKTGTPMELVVYAGTAFDVDGVTPLSGVYRVAVWMGDAFGTIYKFYDAIKPTTNTFRVREMYFMRSKNVYIVPDGDNAICYECISWEVEDGDSGNDPYSVEGLAWNPLGESPTPNSFFADRQTISGATGTLAITQFEIARSQTEVGEPHRFNGSLWYEWTAPSTGTATFDTIGSDALVDTYLGIYTGSVVGSLTEIAVDDDSGGGLSSQVSFAATSGTVYKIQLSYRTNDTGDVTLNWSI